MLNSPGGWGSWNSQGEHWEVNVLLHIQASPDLPSGRDFSQLPITRCRIFFSFCFWGESDLTSKSWFPHTTELVSLSGGYLAVGRWLLRDGGWKWWSDITGASFQKQHRGSWSQPETEGWHSRVIPRAAWAHFASRAGFGVTINICDWKATQMSPHCPSRLDALPWAFASGTKRDLPVQLIVASGNFWDECCEVQNVQCPLVQSWGCKVGQSSAKRGHSAVNDI